MTTNTSQSLMMATSQLNRHIKGTTKNNFGVIVFHYLNNQYPFSHFILYGYWSDANYCWASTKAAFCHLEACWQLAPFKLTSAACFARQKTGELAVSLVRARGGQILSKLSLSKDLENGPWCFNLAPSHQLTQCQPITNHTPSSFQWLMS